MHLFNTILLANNIQDIQTQLSLSSYITIEKYIDEGKIFMEFCNRKINNMSP